MKQFGVTTNFKNANSPGMGFGNGGASGFPALATSSAGAQGLMTQLLCESISSSFNGGGAGAGGGVDNSKTTSNSDINLSDILDLLPGPGNDLIENWDIGSSNSMAPSTFHNNVTSSQGVNPLTLSPGGGASASSSPAGFAPTSTPLTSPTWNNNNNMSNNVQPPPNVYPMSAMNNNSARNMMNGPAPPGGMNMPNLRPTNMRAMMLQQQRYGAVNRQMAPTPPGYPGQRSPMAGGYSQRSPGLPYGAGGGGVMSSNRGAGFGLNRSPTPVSGAPMAPPQRSPIQSPSPLQALESMGNHVTNEPKQFGAVGGEQSPYYRSRHASRGSAKSSTEQEKQEKLKRLLMTSPSSSSIASSTTLLSAALSVSTSPSNALTTSARQHQQQHLSSSSLGISSIVGSGAMLPPPPSSSGVMSSSSSSLIDVKPPVTPTSLQSPRSVPPLPHASPALSSPQQPQSTSMDDTHHTESTGAAASDVSGGDVKMTSSSPHKPECNKILKQLLDQDDPDEEDDDVTDSLGLTKGTYV